MIGPKVKYNVVQAIDALLNENLSDISTVHEESGEVGISISVKLGEVGKNGVNCSVQLGFVKERVKVEARFQVDEQQLELSFPGPEVEVIKGEKYKNQI